MWMYAKKLERENWTQEIRKGNMEIVKKLIEESGGYSKVLDDMGDFIKFVAIQVGCSPKTAKEYVDTIRGAQIFELKRKNRDG